MLAISQEMSYVFVGRSVTLHDVGFARQPLTSRPVREILLQDQWLIVKGGFIRADEVP